MYTTLADIKRRVSSISISDSDITDYIAEAEAWIDSVTGTTFSVSTDTTKIFSTKSWMKYVVIDQAVEVTKVENLVSRSDSGDAWEEINSSDYRLEPENSTPKTLIRFFRGWYKPAYIWIEGGVANIRVTAKFGYSETPPAEIQRITASYVIENMKMDGVIDPTVSSEKMGDASVSYAIQKPNEKIKALTKQLMKYKDFGDIRV